MDAQHTVAVGTITRASPAMDTVLSSWGTLQKKTDRLVGSLDAIFGEERLSANRRGRIALAERTNEIIGKYREQRNEILRALPHEEFMRLYNRGLHILRSEGFVSGPLLIRGIIVGTDVARLYQLVSVLRGINVNQRIADDDKKLAALVGTEIEFNMLDDVTRKYLHTQRLTALLHPVLRREKARQDKTRIESALRRFNEEAAA